MPISRQYARREFAQLRGDVGGPVPRSMYCHYRNQVLYQYPRQSTHLFRKAVCMREEQSQPRPFPLLLSQARLHVSIDAIPVYFLISLSQSNELLLSLRLDQRLRPPHIDPLSLFLVCTAVRSRLEMVTLRRHAPIRRRYNMCRECVSLRKCVWFTG